MKDFTQDIETYYESEIKVLKSLDKKAINEVLNCLLKHYQDESTIYVFGNGGSSATASHMMVDFNKGISEGLDKKFHLVCLNDNIPTLMAIANDLSFSEVFLYQLEHNLKKEDAVIAISGSGNSENVLNAVKYAQKKGSDIIAMTGYDGGALDKMANYHLRANVQDMQISEDVHMSFDHMMMHILHLFLQEVSKK